MFDKYIDFEIQINSLDTSRYAVSVSGPGGDGKSELILPTDDVAYQALAARLEQLDTDESMLVELGQILFRALFQGEIKDVYARSQGTLTAEQGLRLRLNIAPADVAVAALPWEFLCDPDQGPLALLDAPIVRYLPQQSVVPTLASTLPLKVLLTAAQPPPATNIERELNEVEMALAGLGDHVQISVEPHLTPAKLQKLLREGFHIWHFVGQSEVAQATRTTYLLFEDANGDAERVSATQLGIMLNRSGLRLVVLDACEGARLATDAFRSVAPALIRAQVSAVIAMQFPVPETATRAFSGEFYRALTEGFPIDACVTEGRKAVMNTSGLHRADWGIPAVYTRAPDGKLFELPAPEAPTAPDSSSDAAPAESQHPEAEPRQPGSNLPPQPTALVGRVQDVQKVRDLLVDPGVRLVTLTGPGGIGKTHLSLQIAGDLLGEFPDGVFFVRLASIGKARMVAAKIAKTLGIEEAGDQPLAERLENFLVNRQALLVLDNFEHVIAAATLVSDLLAAAPRLKVLVTSRAALRVRYEYEFPVQPLDLPDLQDLPPVEELLLYSSVALFVRRVQAIKPAFTLTEENARAVAEICLRLDGLPLAIELAAARKRASTSAELLEALSNRLDLLVGGPRDAEDRQQTLRATIEWSYNLLDAAHQMFFARLAVFAGGCAQEAAEAVCGALEAENLGREAGGQVQASGSDQPVSIRDMLEALVANNLLRQIEGSGEGSRFVMLATIREYALEQLIQNNQVEALRRRHADYYLALAEEAEQAMAGAEQAAWFERLEDEHDNLRAALSWALEQHAAEIAARLGAALWRFWYTRGYLSEGRDWLKRVLESLDAMAPAASGSKTAGRSTAQARTSHSVVRARVLNGAGGLAWTQGDYAQAQALYEEGLALFRKLKDTGGIATSLNNLGNVALRQADDRRAQTLYEESLTLFQELGDRVNEARLLSNLGVMAHDRGDDTQAQTLYEKSLALRRELEDTRGIAQSLINLGEAACGQGNYTQGQLCYQESLKLRQALEDKPGIARSLEGLAQVAYGQGEYARAIAQYQESLALRMEKGLRDKQGIARSLEGLAQVAGVLGQPQRSAQLWGAATALREAIGAPMSPAERAQAEQAQAAAQAQLDPAAWAAAWKVGQARSLEQVIADAAAEAAWDELRAPDAEALPAGMVGHELSVSAPRPGPVELSAASAHA